MELPDDWNDHPLCADAATSKGTGGGAEAGETDAVAGGAVSSPDFRFVYDPGALRPEICIVDNEAFLERARLFVARWTTQGSGTTVRCWSRMGKPSSGSGRRTRMTGRDA